MGIHFFNPCNFEMCFHEESFLNFNRYNFEYYVFEDELIP